MARIVTLICGHLSRVSDIDADDIQTAWDYNEDPECAPDLKCRSCGDRKAVDHFGMRIDADRALAAALGMN